MCSLRFENNLLAIEGVRFASISKKTPISKLSFAFVSLALRLPLLHWTVDWTRTFAWGMKKIRGRQTVNVVIKNLSGSLLKKRVGEDGVTPLVTNRPIFQLIRGYFIWRRRNRYSSPRCFLHGHCMEYRREVNAVNRVTGNSKFFTVLSMKISKYLWASLENIQYFRTFSAALSAVQHGSSCP
jgi:hypothetical protein